MEMKKQVLSFTEFVNEAYSMMSEGQSWGDVKTLLNDKIDKETANILAYMEDCFSSDAREGVKVNILEAASLAFGKTIAERFNGKATTISEIETTINNIECTKVVQGKIYVANTSLLNSDPFVGGIKVGAFKKDDSGRMYLQDFLNMINLFNIKKGSSLGVLSNKDGKSEFANINKSDKEVNKDSLWGKLGFKVIGDGKKIRYSGSEDQYYITEAGTQMAIAKWENKNKKAQPISGVTPVTMSVDRGIKYDTVLKQDKGKKAGKAEFTYVFYALDPKSVEKGRLKGDSNIKFTDIKEVKIPVKEPAVTQTIEIRDTGALFGVGSPALTDQGKKDIYNAITQNFTSVSEIIVQGSASQEGPASKKAGKYDEATYKSDSTYNLDLAKKRAESVVTHLKTVSAADIKTDQKDPAIIQPAAEENEEARKKWRKVTLTIKGTKITEGEMKEKVIYIPITGKAVCDKVIIKEVQMSFFVDIRPEFAKQKGLFKKGVDTEMYGRTAKND